MQVVEVSPSSSMLDTQDLPLLENFEILIGVGNITAETDILAMVSQQVSAVLRKKRALRRGCLEIKLLLPF